MYRLSFVSHNALFHAHDAFFQLKVLRQLVELQLCHCQEIKLRIDRAWGVIHNKHKKMEMTSAPPPPEDPNSMENLQLIPLGQDQHRKRYWVIDGPCTLCFSSHESCYLCVFAEDVVVLGRLRALSRFHGFVLKYAADTTYSFVLQCHLAFIFQRIHGKSPQHSKLLPQVGKNMSPF